VRTILLLMSGLVFPLVAQEATSGFDLRATVAAETVYSRELSESPRNGAPAAAGIRAVFYPTWKIGRHWSVSAAAELISRPYFEEDFSLPGHALKGHILQATLGYSQVWKNASVSVKAGQMPTAFGNFLLRYDDMDNPLTGLPPNYGYYGAAVSTLGLMGIQLDATSGKWDGRVQFANSSPANPRSIFDKDQYGNWAGGVGYTVFQGLRVGFSTYRGPYLDRQDQFFFPGESRPKDLPATAQGVDLEWARGHWNVVGEWQHVVLTYHAIPNFRQATAYVEARRVLHPRWYIAARVGVVTNSVGFGSDSLESSIGFRPAAHELIKAGYVLERNTHSGQWSQTVALQAIATLHPLAVAWK
jgi:hypothetical protein